MIKHIIAQKDVVFSNSMVEALNKIIKYQFLFLAEIASRKQLWRILITSVYIYNNIRPQLGLKGSTPKEVFNGTPFNFAKYATTFIQQKKVRSKQNRAAGCNVCG